jgi:hypothetical protein
MPFRDYNTLYTCIQFRCNTEMPSMIYDACVATDTVSQTVYIQKAVVAALARDLDIPEATLLHMLPSPLSRAKHLFNPHQLRKNPRRIGSANTIEDVR